MNTSALKSFAPQVRTQLMEAVRNKLHFVLTTDSADLREKGTQVSSLRRQAEKDEEALVERVAYTWFNRLAAMRFLDARDWHPFRLRVLTSATEGQTQPEILRAFRSGELPEELATLTDVARLNRLLDGDLPTAIEGADPQGEVYRALFLTACRFYHRTMAFLFEEVDDESELLLPDDLLTATSVAEDFRVQITDEDCKEVEVLGWLYQFYISEKKDAVMARKKAVPSKDIPAVTQLFTPHWIVRYLVENSLGRLWLNSRPQSQLRDHMPYYVADAPQGDRDEGPGTRTNYEDTTLQGSDRLAEGDGLGDGDLPAESELPEAGNLRIEKPDSTGGSVNAVQYRGGSRSPVDGGIPELPLDSTGLAGGSGNATDSSAEVQLSSTGQAPNSRTTDHRNQQDAALPAGEAKKLTPNPSSLTPDVLTVDRPEDIKLLDPACGSGHMLTYAFDLLVRIYEEEGYAASEIPERILTHNLHGLEICPRAAQLAQFALVCKAREQSRRAFRRAVAPQVLCLRDVVLTPEEVQTWSRETGVEFTEDELQQIHQFRENTETFGALIQPVLDWEELVTLIAKIGEQVLAGDLLEQNTHRKLRLVLVQAEMLSQRYQVVVANPPYMGGKGMNSALKTWLPTKYSEAKSDLMTCFMVRCQVLCTKSGLWAMLNLPSWMFIGTYSSLRSSLLSHQTIKSLLHLGRGLFGPDFGTVAFIIQNKKPKSDETGIYRRLFEKQVSVRRPEEIENLYLTPDYNRFLYIQFDFTTIPNTPIAYWVGPKTREIFRKGTRMEDIASPRQGLATGNNDTFLRYWHEISNRSSNFTAESTSDWFDSDQKWAPYSKGGPLRKWYGNGEYMIAFDRVNYERLSQVGNHLPSRHLYFRAAINWSLTSSSGFAARYRPQGYVFDVNGMSSFVDNHFQRLLGLVNSSVGVHLLKILNPTMAFQVGDIKALPCSNVATTDCESEVEQATILARADWDNFETSWDFHDLPQLRAGDWEIGPSQLGGLWKGNTLAESLDHYASYCSAAIRRMRELETENNRLWIDAYGLQDELTPEVPEEEITLARADARKDIAAFLSYAVGCMMGRYSLDQPGLILADAGDTIEQYLAKVSQRTEPLQEERALADPGSVLLDVEASPSCFACGRETSTAKARFILADHYDREPDQICGRPMIYCPHCAEEKKEKIRLNIALPDFSLCHAITSQWAEAKTFVGFLSLAGCFGHRVPARLQDLQFPPDDDAIVPVLDGEWFTDDIVGRTREFLRVTFGEETLQENLQFIEQSLGKPLRKYFLTDFYKDHLQTYKKRPIYWMFQSPKKGFRALVYLHRYTRDTINTLLNDYLREYIKKIEEELPRLENLESTANTTREKNAARKEREKLQKVLTECQDWERDTLLPLAQQRIDLDLDDGVKANYPKFKGALAPVAGL